MYQRGFAAAVARFRGGGIGLGALRVDHKNKAMQICNGGFIMRRRYCSDVSSKSLRLCFCEGIRSEQYSARDVVRSIKLSDLLSPPPTTTTRFEHEAYHDSENRRGNPFPWGCGRFRSQIVFAGGSTGLLDHIYTKAGVRGEIVAFDPNSLTFKAPKFTSPRKHHYEFPIALFELQGKLYCLDTRNQQYYSTAPYFQMMGNYHHYADAPPAFAVLDPEGDNAEFQAKWLPLESPPPAILYVDKKSHKLNELMYCAAESKILVWNPNKAGVHYFDVSRPKKGWTKLHSPLATTLPFVKGSWCDTADHHQGTLIFTIDCTPKISDDGSIFHGPQSVQALLMSRNLDSLQAMKPLLLQLSEIPPEFRNKDSLLNPDGPTESCLVHLGDRKLCLILHKYFFTDYGISDVWSDCDDSSDSGGLEQFDPHSGRNRGILHLMTFEYQVTPDMNMEYRLLTSRNYEYYTEMPDNEYTTWTHTGSLTKAFVI